VPGLGVELHLNEDIAREKLSHKPLTLTFDLLFSRYENLREQLLSVVLLYTLPKSGLNPILITGVRMHDIPFMFHVNPPVLFHHSFLPSNLN
jgi:hypothetical protein